MTGRKLFKKRFLDDVKYQREVLGTVIDWTFWLYVFIPFAIIAVLFYIDFWRDIAAYWLEPLPHQLIIILLFSFSISGKYRSFMLEADQLFLLDRLKLYRNLRKVTFTYSLLQIACTTTVPLIVSLPWLVQLMGVGLEQLLILYIVLLAIRLLHASIKRKVYHPIKRGVLTLFIYLVTVYMVINLSMELLLFSSAILLIFLIGWHILTITPTKRYFFQEVNEENKERVRYAKFILGAAREVEKTPIRLGKRPLIFRNSKRLFKNSSPENGLFEVLIKGLLRHSVYLRSYIQIIGLTLSAVIILPIWLKWIVFFSFILFLNYNSWLRGLYEKMLDQYFFSVVPVQKNVREKVWPRFRRMLIIPAVSVVGIAIILVTLLSIG